MSNLDDYFAKKDKKKNKKPKFVAPDDLLKALEATRREAAERAKADDVDGETTENGVGLTSNVSVATNQENITNPVEENADDEWLDPKEEPVRDYSGLKIGHLKLHDDDDADSNAEHDLDENGDQIISDEHTRSGPNGPWKSVTPADKVLHIAMKENTPKPAPSKTARFVPSALRKMNAAPVPTARHRAAPDITNADYFPSLNAARPEEQRKKKTEPAFAEVRHGGRVQRIQPQAAAAPTSAANRFESLGDTD